MNDLKILFVLLLSFSFAFSQENWEQFKKDSKKYYPTIEENNIENFSCLISSSEYFRFIKDKADSTFCYPLKIIWMKDGRIFYLMQPLPPNRDKPVQQQLINKIEELKKLFKGTLADWQQFCLFTPFNDIPENVTANFSNDTVGVSFKISDNAKDISVRKTFTRGGQLARVFWASGDVTIVTYPDYRERENKWVCQGWKSQIYHAGNISGGLGVELDLNEIEGIWLPSRFEIVAQSKESAGQISFIELYLKDYIFNQKFEIVNEPSKKSESPESPPQ